MLRADYFINELLDSIDNAILIMESDFELSKDEFKERNHY